MYIYRCEDSLEGIFTAIYRVYEEHRSREEVLLTLDDELRLFSTVTVVEPDEERFQKVIRTLRRDFGEKDYEYLCLALASTDEEKAQAVYATVAAGLRSGCGAGHLFDNLADTQVNKAFRLAQNASRESMRMWEFVRFEELENGILYSKIKPKNNVLVFSMPHFADRFPQEHFVLHDVGRDLFGVHPAGEEWFLLRGEKGSPDLPVSASEEKYQLLFKEFCRSIAIDERRNLQIQRGMLPLRFREYMTEFR